MKLLLFVRGPRRAVLTFVMLSAALLAARPAVGQPPVLHTVVPAGGQIGTTVEVTVAGAQLQALRTLHCSLPGVLCELVQPNRFRLTIPAGAPPGQYDLWGAGDHGVTPPRTFVVGTLPEQLESEPNESLATAASVPLGVVINGQIDKPGDVDHFRFDARRGQRVVIECRAERSDSRLRAVLELFDAAGKRLAVNRGYFGIDPLLDFRAPADGAYVVKVQDLTASGGAENYYRLDIDAGPRVAFAWPNVIPCGQSSRVTLFGWNLPGASTPSAADRSDLERLDVEIPAAAAQPVWPLPLRLQPAQAVLAGACLPYLLPGSSAPVLIGLSDAPVVTDRGDNHAPAAAQELSVPCEVSGQLAAGDERDWYAFSARSGEVLYFEALGQRLAAPVDLQLSVYDGGATPRELARFSDELRGSGGPFPTHHLDPVGRWVCPADGRYLVAVRNLTGGLHADPRRLYRLSVRREEPDFQVVALPRSAEPAALNVPQGGRTVFDLVAFRRRGWAGAICVSARDLPPGVECPDIWLGPGVERAVGVVSAAPSATAAWAPLRLQAASDLGGRELVRAVLSGTVVRTGTPTGWGRLTSQSPLAIAGAAPLRITANAHVPLEHHLYGKLPAKHAPGGIVDVAVDVERRDAGHQAPVKLSGVGLPESIAPQSSVIPAGENAGYISFYLPPTLPPGRYSFAIRAETTAPNAAQKAEAVVVYSNPATIDVQPAAFLVGVDPFAVTRARRGETIQIAYTSQRLNGFIGKMHTELAAPGRITNVVGLRGRGETFVGQSDKGSLQIVVNDDAPLGPQPFLRLFTVGVLEDEPIYQGSHFLTLEIVE